MVKTRLTDVQAKELMGQKQTIQMSHKWTMYNIVSVDEAALRKTLNDPSMSIEAIKSTCGDAFVFHNEPDQKIHLNYDVLSQIAALGLAR